MWRWLLMRLCWLPFSLLGITFVTFAVLDAAPVDRAQIEAARQADGAGFTTSADRERAIAGLRLRYGMIDPETLEPAPLAQRYANWVRRAVTLRFAGPTEDDITLRRRLGEALPVTMWLGLLALLVATGLGVPLGIWMGMRAGSRGDRAASKVLFVLAGVPEFLFATLLLLGFAGAWLAWFPPGGLRSKDAAEWMFGWQVLDFAWHLALPVAVMAVAPIVLIARFLRDSVARTLRAPFAANLHALGLEPGIVRWRVLRNGCAPLATLVGFLLPMLVGGSIVCESLFSLNGLGRLAYEAVLHQDQAMVMALVVVTSVVTLLALIASDLAHHVVDPRVRWQQ